MDYNVEPIHIRKLEIEAERLQRRFEQATEMDDFLRISEEASWRIATLAPISEIVQRYLMISELAHREYERAKLRQSPEDEDDRGVDDRR